MDFVKEGAEIFIPDGKPVEEALQRITHLAIAAHQDDIEIMAYHGILECFGKNENWFMGVVVTNGAGSPRDSLYADHTDEQMQRVRNREQKKAAYVGEYGAVALLNYPSGEVKDGKNHTMLNEIKEIIVKTRPEIVYTHNLADKHDTHVAVALRVIQAIRLLPKEQRPKKVFGCEVWRSLDWVNDDEKVLFDVSGHPNISAAIVGVHDSQICGGKRYDLATEGRRRANATYAQSHTTDNSEAYTYGMDLTALTEDDSLDIQNFILGYIERFKKDVAQRLQKMF
ncbi:MAG: PIG-L family deacetylase [Clostridiaceae bacterium]|jgi:LmbE family N-acetylglucosaminyl deacetylase|nr:PIG-L family deacetylase [Clostridiaceae bacterium]